MSVQLPAIWVRAIEAALDKKPCGRCKQDHPLRSCPAGDSNGKKGDVWDRMGKQIHGAADKFLKTHAKYDYVASTQSQKTKQANTGASKATAKLGTAPNPHHGGGMRSGKSSNTDSYRALSWAPVQNYCNNQRASEMYYPAVEEIDEQPSDNGKAWVLPNSMRDRSKVLKIKESDAKYALRKGFFSSTGNNVVLTNHFEYNLNTDTFYEYKILDLGSKIRRRLRELFKNAISDWPFLQQNQDFFATNYVDTIVAWKPLHSDLGEPDDTDKGSAEWIRLIPLGDSPVTARFKFVKKIDAHTLRQYASADPSYEDANFEDIARCLNIVISKSFDSRVHKLSSNKFFVKSARSPLVDSKSQRDSNALEIIRGYFYSVKPGMGNVILNFNISTTAVFRPVLVTDFLSDTDTFTTPELRAAALKNKYVYLEYERRDQHHDGGDAEKQKQPHNREEGRYFRISGLQTYGGVIEDLTFRKKRGVLIDDDDARRENDADYASEDELMTVVEHLTRVFGRSPRLGIPAVNVGSKDRPIWYAQEFLRLVPYQPYTRPVPDSFTASMVKQACRNPAVSRAYIEREGLRNIGFSAGSGAVKFGANIPISLVPSMLQVPHHVHPFPKAHYSEHGKPPGTITAAQSSHWKFPRFAHSFFVTANPGAFQYAILRGPGTLASDPQTYDLNLRAHFEKCGLNPQQCRRVPEDTLHPHLAATDEATMERKLQEVVDRGAILVILVLRGYDVTTYRNFKTLSDRTFGLHSMCMTCKRFDDRSINETLTNMMMKMNLKFGGINHGVSGVSRWLKNTMIIGADLIHPGASAFPGTPSIAAIVASVDDHGGKCLGSMRLQDVHKTDREIMDETSVRDMVKERLSAWISFRKCLPANIIYFRDGVSTGHYAKVRSVELRAIRTAYAECQEPVGENGSPAAPAPATVGTLNLAAVIVTKRHHTRFYVQQPSQGDRWGNKNTLPGTCVDQLVTSPYYQDFFLQSHSGIKGTAKPAHYFVLENGIRDLSLDALRDLIHQLCYSYVRSMSGVSYVSPTYYADRLCERGRLYIRRYYNGDDASLRADFAAEKSRRDPDPHIKADSTREHDRDDWKDWLRERIHKDFYCFERHPDPARRWMNPFDKKLAHTMFWM